MSSRHLYVLLHMQAVAVPSLKVTDLDGSPVPILTNPEHHVPTGLTMHVGHSAGRQLAHRPTRKRSALRCCQTPRCLRRWAVLCVARLPIGRLTHYRDAGLKACNCCSAEQTAYKANDRCRAATRQQLHPSWSNLSECLAPRPNVWAGTPEARRAQRRQHDGGAGPNNHADRVALQCFGDPQLVAGATAG